MKYQDQIQVLRQRVPVGMLEGLDLLEKTNGDVSRAELLFKRDMVAKVVSLTGVDEAIAGWYLEKSNYDIPAALKGIDEEFLTLTKRILRRYGHDKESGLRAIVNGIEQVHDMTRPVSWLEAEEINQLAPEVSCVVMIMEWLAYAEYEGLPGAMYFYIEDVIARLTQDLHDEDLARTLSELKTVHDNQHLEQEDTLARRGFTGPTPEWTSLEERLIDQLPALFDALYGYVEKHVDKFP